MNGRSFFLSNFMILSVALFHAIRSTYSLSLLAVSLWFLVFYAATTSGVLAFLKKKELEDRQVPKLLVWTATITVFALLFGSYRMFP